MDHPFLDVQCKSCSDGTANALYVEIFRSDDITEANRTNKMIPKYGFHLSAVCTKCGTHIKSLKQTDDIIGKKFILIPE